MIIGSGEMAPRMARVQREVVQRLAAERRRPPRAAVIDTPYGFQANADDLSAGASAFFSRRLGLSVAVASFRRDGDVLEREQALARVREADFVFSGPGSPSYALRHWAGSEVPRLLRDKLTAGGAVAFASAAALTLGRFTLPVYEIYKAGEEPRWIAGLDVLSVLGIDAAVVPHWDNREGAGHDTRYCFVGERRMRVMEEQLPAETRILGVDEHTALVIDAGEGRARVDGRGGLTIRRAGRAVVHPAGTELPIDELRGPLVERPAEAPQPADRTSPSASAEGTGVLHALLANELPPAARGGIVELGERLQRAEQDRPTLVEPLVEALLEIRREARAGGDFARADAIRRRLVELGVRVTDAPDGSTAFELP